MPTIKETLERMYNGSMDDGTGCTPKAYDDFMSAKDAVRNTPEGKAFVKAANDCARLHSELLRARAEQSCVTIKVTGLESDLKAAEHAVTVLGAIEAPKL